MNELSQLAAAGDNQEIIPLIIAVIAVALVVLLVTLVVMIRKRK